MVVYATTALSYAASASASSSVGLPAIAAPMPKVSKTLNIFLPAIQEITRQKSVSEQTLTVINCDIEQITLKLNQVNRIIGIVNQQLDGLRSSRELYTKKREIYQSLNLIYGIQALDQEFTASRLEELERQAELRKLGGDQVKFTNEVSKHKGSLQAQNEIDVELSRKLAAYRKGEIIANHKPVSSKMTNDEFVLCKDLLTSNKLNQRDLKKFLKDASSLGPTVLPGDNALPHAGTKHKSEKTEKTEAEEPRQKKQKTDLATSKSDSLPNPVEVSG